MKTSAPCWTVEAARHAISEAQRAESDIAAIARTRRPTAAESLLVCAAYCRAASAQEFLRGSKS